MPDIVVDMNRGDVGDSNQSCWGFVLPRFLFLGSHSAQGLTSSEGESRHDYSSMNAQAGLWES